MYKKILLIIVLMLGVLKIEATLIKGETAKGVV